MLLQIKQFLRREAIFCLAVFLACASSLFQAPKKRFCGLPGGVSILPRLAASVCKMMMRSMSNCSVLPMTSASGTKVKSATSFVTNIELLVLLALLLVNIAAVLHVLPKLWALGVTLAAVLLLNWRLLLAADYSLLLTFIGFFIFIYHLVF